MYTKAPADPYRTFASAVDGFNAKVDGLGGSTANQTVAGSRGAFTVPMGAQYGAQFDGFAGTFDSRFIGNVGGHFFWRNPAQGLVGVFADYTSWDSRVGGVNVGRVAAEAEAYLGRWTLSVIAGVETGNSVTGVVGTEVQSFNINTRFFDVVNVSYYIQDNFKVFAGHRYQGGKHAAALGGEWAFALNGGKMGSLFAEGRLGSENNHGVFGGLRFYFGQREKTLIRRHREDDPDFVPSAINTITNSGTTTNTPVSTPAPQSENGPD
ncbi:MAG: hypothetical protein K2Y27_21995 [Xanthobacteraceae bacterium]|nr:hypothetical protein [Xanthobacteraceae bacterium]